MRKNLTENYVAGWMEGRGCFAVHRRGIHHSVYFKISASPEHEKFVDSIFVFLRENLDIRYRSYKQNKDFSFYIANNNSIVRIIEFFKRSCYRNDYMTTPQMIEMVKKRYDRFNEHCRNKIKYPWIGEEKNDGA